MRAALEQLRTRLESHAKSAVLQKRHQLERTALRLRASGPQQTMERGYAIVLKNGKLVRSASAVMANDPLTVVMADGTIRATATEIESKEGGL